MPIPLLAGLGPEEIVLIIVVILLLFGATKLPELARGSGRALRIFKAETKGLMDGESEDADASKQADTTAQSDATAQPDVKPDDTEHRSGPSD
ncbi:MAG: Sec-independent protein translocase subunit TatA [Marmoricola sp.]